LLKIGICDDIPILCDVIEYCIHLYEDVMGVYFDIDKFSSGEELLEKYSSGVCYDILFLDHNMKKLTGFETAKRIRQNHSDNPCSIIIVTSSDNHNQFNSIHPLQVITKPVSAEVISNVLTKALSVGTS